MQRALRLIGVFVAVVVGSMLWCWLLFGPQRVVCSGEVQSLFVAGSTWYAGFAVFWGAMATLVPLARSASVRGILGAVGLGSFYHVLHQGMLVLPLAINAAISALFAIVLTQSLAVWLFLRTLSLTQKGMAVRQGFLLGIGGLMGVAGAQLLTASIPCESVVYVEIWEQLLASSVVWYAIWGILPMLVTAFLFSGSRRSHSIS